MASPTAEVDRAGRAALGEVGGHGALDPARLLGRPRWARSIDDRQDGRGGVGHRPAGDVRGGAVDRLEHAREAALGVDVAARGEADAAGDGGGDVGDDVAEEVVGDDDVEAARVGREEDRRGVDVLVGGLDIRELGPDLLHGAPPEVAGMREDVVLVHEREVPPGARRARPKASRTTRSTPKRVLTLTSVAISLRGARAQRPAVAHVGPSVPSRTTTKSMPPGATRSTASGLSTPG